MREALLSNCQTDHGVDHEVHSSVAHFPSPMGEVTLVGWGPIPRHITAKAVAVMEPASVIKEFSPSPRSAALGHSAGADGQKVES